ncbi:MAG: type I polyketide synthase [Pseudomonadota bacterium]
MPRIAITGMSCRFPGAESLDAYWDLLTEGRSGISEVPADRWDINALYDEKPKSPGKMASRFGGFLRDVRGFDAKFFGISDAEANHMDPQQRILLEEVWHALENANIDPQTLSGSKTGVFVGAMANDYVWQCVADAAKITPYTGSGNGLSMLANRVSYQLNLRGISTTIDTACSSSLVAVSRACQSLESGEIDLAIVAGSNLILAPGSNIFYSQAGLLSPSGQCRTFDKSADGITRGEGVGVVILKRSSDVKPNEAPLVYATVDGWAVNHGGRGNGVSAPNRGAQEEVIRAAHRSAKVAPSHIDYVELHGTGTIVGDPIEAMALDAALQADKLRDGQCLVGSVKSNIGHLEGAAGIAALIKVALSIKHNVIPRSLHYRTPNPFINLDSLCLKVVEASTPWPERKTPRVAGVSSFGLGGTNCHLVVSKYLGSANTLPAKNNTENLNYFMLPLSARSPAALVELAKAYRLKIDTPSELELSRFCVTAACCKASLEYRALVIGKTPQALSEDLDRLIAKYQTFKPTKVAKQFMLPRLAFAFSGQGSQWLGMGRALYRRFEVFREKIDVCDALFQQHANISVQQLLLSCDSEETIRETAHTQPLIFSYQYALAEQLAVFGIKPNVVVGHSIGEYAAAVVAGVMSIEQAVQLVSARCTSIRDHASTGSMVAVHCEEPAANILIEDSGGRSLAIAAVNSEHSVTIAGTDADVNAIAVLADERNIKAVHLRVSHAFHSPLLDGALPHFREYALKQCLKTPGIDFVSTVSGKMEESQLTDANYWVEQIVKPVRFLDAVRTIREQSRTIWVEIGPRPVLSLFLNEIEKDPKSFVASTYNARLGEDYGFLELIKRLYEYGMQIRWDRYSPDTGFTRLPTYPFQHESYWHDIAITEDTPAQVVSSERSEAVASPASINPLPRFDKASIARMNKAPH